MARYLSREWIDELDRAASASTLLHEQLAGVTLVVEHRVTREAGGDVAYVIRIDDGRVRVEAGSSPDADIVLVADYDTARALARGDVNAQRAFAAGRLKVRGRIDRLVAHARALGALTAGLEAVRATTVFDG
ncbi:MAG TPA: SCP2 sterol-binding domain-containing protein [Acidimicrobiia bacterium]